MNVVGVHGILNHLKGEETIHKDWEPAMCDGLRRADYAGKLSLRCAFYGDLFRRQGGKAGIPKFEFSDLSEWEKELMVSLLQGDEPQGEDATKARIPVSAQKVVNGLLKLKTFKLLGERLMFYFIRQVWSYLNDSEVHEQALARLDGAIDNATRVVVAHSLGSVVAYEWLCSRAHSIDSFVTLGSPLGVDLVFNQLTPRPAHGLGAWPGVKRWTNVLNFSPCSNYQAWSSRILL